jgi:hypothetical protein
MAPVHISHGWQLVYIVVPAAVTGGSTPGQFQLRMGADVGVPQHRVALFGEHVAVRAHQQRSERRFTAGARRPGELDGPAQMAFFVRRHGCSVQM